MSDAGEVSQVVYVNTDMMKSPLDGENLFETRRIAYQNCSDTTLPKITISVTAYNRLEKTRRCVGYILEFTKDFDYELLLIDNGSTDGTLEYFQSVPFDVVQIKLTPSKHEKRSTIGRKGRCKKWDRGNTRRSTKCRR